MDSDGERLDDFRSELGEARKAVLQASEAFKRATQILRDTGILNPDGTEAIRKVIEDYSLAVERYTSVMFAWYEHSAAERSAAVVQLVNLTPRQLQIVKLVCDGLHADQIAAQLGISPKTVEFHRTRIAKQLGIRSVAGIVRWAVRNGLVEG